MLQVHLRYEFYNIIFKITNKSHIASGSAPPYKIVGVGVTVVPIKLYYEIWPSETEGDHNRHSCFTAMASTSMFNVGKNQRQKQDFFLAQGFGLKHRISPTVVELREVCSFTFLAACYIRGKSKEQTTGAPNQESWSPLLFDYFPKLGNSSQPK